MELIATRMQIPIESKKLLMVPDPLTGGVRAERRVYHKPFDLSHVSDFVVDGAEDGSGSKPRRALGEGFRFGNREEIEVVMYCLFGKWQPETNSFGADIDPVKLESTGYIQAMFPRRGQTNSHLEYLKDTWANFRQAWGFRDQTNGLWRQPIDRIQRYFGCELAIYFGTAFLPEGGERSPHSNRTAFSPSLSST